MREGSAASRGGETCGEESVGCRRREEEEGEEGRGVKERNAEKRTPWKKRPFPTSIAASPSPPVALSAIGKGEA